MPVRQQNEALHEILHAIDAGANMEYTKLGRRGVKVLGLGIGSGFRRR